MGRSGRGAVEKKGLMTKAGLVLAFAALTVLAVMGMSSSALGAVGALDAWTNISSTAPNNTNGTINAGNLTVSAGTNRLFVVSVCVELAASNSGTTLSASLGGTALTLIDRTLGTFAQEHCYMGYLTNAQIPAGSSALTVPYNFGQNVTGAHVKWASYTGVDQTTPINSSSANYNGATSVTFGAAINYLVDGWTFYAAANGGSPATMTAPGGFTVAETAMPRSPYAEPLITLASTRRMYPVSRL